MLGGVRVCGVDDVQEQLDAQGLRQRRVQELEKVIAQRCATSDAAVLLATTPGVGAYTATALACRVGRVERGDEVVREPARGLLREVGADLERIDVRRTAREAGGQEAASRADLDRITSYNVCYTKLLRSRAQDRPAPAVPKWSIQT